MQTIIIPADGKNATPRVTDAIRQLTATGEEALLRFEPGEYRFYKEGAHVAPFFPSNNASGEKRVIFPLLGCKNLTVDGDGADFLFCDRVFPFILQNCENITLKNFTMDFSFPRHCQGTVTACDEEGFSLRMEEPFRNYEVREGNILFHTGSDIISTADKKLFFQDLTDHSVRVAYLFAGDCRDCDEGLAAPLMRTDASDTGDGLHFRYRPDSFRNRYGVGDTVFIGNDENRENDMIFCEFSENLRFENIRMFRGAGMGIIAQICRNITVQKVQIAPRNPDDLLSITADGIHAVNCSGQFTIRDCHIDRSIDDAINIHGAYFAVNNIPDAHTVQIGYRHPEQEGLIPCLAGDLLHVSDPDTLEERGQVRVREVRYTPDRKDVRLIFDRDIGDLLRVGSLLENPDRMPDILLEGNTVVACPHILLSSSGKTVVRRNRLSLTYNDIAAHDALGYWYESGVIGEMILTDNDFENPAGKRILLDTHRHKTTARRHGRLVIENNRFRAAQTDFLCAEALEELVVKGNRFSLT